MIGPPGVGKSTFASRFVLEHPYYRYCAIDAYRVEHYDSRLSLAENEQVVWKKFYRDIYHAKDVVVESVGLDWRLLRIFAKLADRPKLTIAFVGDPAVIESRLRERQHKRPVPFQYDFEDEVNTIWYVLRQLAQGIVHSDVSVQGTDLTPSQIYEIVTSQITSFRIDHSG